jgi:hypothetical protein
MIDLGFAFRGGDIKASKLIIEESRTTAESGVILHAGSEELVIVAGAFPFTLAICGLKAAPFKFDPEYPLDLYTRISLT